MPSKKKPTRKPQTSGYRPFIQYWGMQPRDLPLFNPLYHVPVMMLEPTVRLALAMRAGPLCQVEFAYKQGEEWNDWWSEFHTDPLTLCLNGTGHRRHPEWDWTGPACVALAVDDVRKAIAVCRQRRVKVLIGPTETRVCWMAWIADPDGNRICLHSRKGGSAG